MGESPISIYFNIYRNLLINTFKGETNMFNVVYINLEAVLNEAVLNAKHLDPVWVFRKGIMYEKIPTFKVGGDGYFNMGDGTNNKLFKIVNIIDARNFDLKISREKVDYIACCIEEIPSKADRIWNE